jgi:predicted PurR-regulated permease PerM
MYSSMPADRWEEVMRVRRIGALCVTLCLLLAMIPLVSAAGASIVVQAPDKLPDVGEICLRRSG